MIEKVWEKSYSVIANVNDALDHIDRRKDGLDSVNYRIIKGELLAVRAYIHFDLIRLFGCSDLAGRTDLESRHTVPYLTSVDKDAAPQLTCWRSTPSGPGIPKASIPKPTSTNSTITATCT